MQNYREENPTAVGVRQSIALPKGVNISKREAIDLSKLVTFIEDENTRALMSNVIQKSRTIFEDDESDIILNLATLIKSMNEATGVKGLLSDLPKSRRSISADGIENLNIEHLYEWDVFKKSATEHPATALLRFFLLYFTNLEDSDQNDLCCIHEYLMVLMPIKSKEVY